MLKITKRKKVGRPSMLNDENLLERNIKIWYSFHYLHVPIWELMKEHNLKKDAIRKALSFVNKEFLKIPNEQILQGSMYAIKERIRNLANSLKTEYDKKEPSTRNIVELNRELREENRDLMKLENIFKEHYSIELEGKGMIKDILSVLAKEKK